MSAPNGGETWRQGQSYAITWNRQYPPEGCGNSVKIELLQNGSVCHVIAENEANDGHFAWTAAGCGGGAGGTTVRVTNLETGDSDVSDGTFTISAPVDCRVTVSAPNGGETWQQGQSYAITWNRQYPPEGCGNSVKIELLQNGSVCQVITENEANDGHFSWTAGGCGGGTGGYTVRVTNLETGDSDVSDGTFTISAPVDCRLTVSAPNGGETWQQGQSYAITWNRQYPPEGCGNSVKIELLQNGSVCHVIAATEANDGHFSWTAGGCGGGTGGYSVRVTNLVTGDSDFSDANFSIVAGLSR